MFFVGVPIYVLLYLTVVKSPLKMPLTAKLCATVASPGLHLLQHPLCSWARGVIRARKHTVLAIVASIYRIYLARNSPDWSSGKLVSP